MRKTDKIEKCDKSEKIDFAKLLGFDGLSEQISGSVDFQDETLNAKLGAKVGVEAMN
jgi:hypothetical protein